MYKKFNVLCVDDESINLDILVRILHDYTSYAVLSALEALEILDTTPIDIIILDIIMPEISGLELCRQIKENPKTTNIPIIFITSNSDDETIISAFEYGGIDFINKPINPINLQQRVKLYLKDKHIFNINKQYYFDTKSSILYKDKSIVKLSASEQKLLKLFCEKINIPIDPIDISHYIFDDYTKEYNNKTIRNLISSLKSKLPNDLIRSIYGQGYIFEINF